MSDLDYVLSDKFFEYTGKMKEIHEKLKVHEVELKDFYQKHREKTSELKKEAADLHAEWIEWKKEAELSTTDS